MFGIPKTDVERLMSHYGISEEEACGLLATYPVDLLLPERGSGLVPVQIVGSTQFGIPKTDVERLMSHYGISEEEACELLATYPVDLLLPERGSGLVRVQIIGSTQEELASGLMVMEGSLVEGEKAEINLCTEGLPTREDLDEMYLGMVAMGCHVTLPTGRFTDGIPTTRFVLQKGSPAWPLIIPLILPTLTLGLIAFGISKIDTISKALVPILLITVIGVVGLAVVLRKPAEKYVERGGKVPLLSSTQKKHLSVFMKPAPGPAPEDGWDNFLGRDYKKGDSVFWINPDHFKKELPPFLKNIYVTPDSYKEMVEKYDGHRLQALKPPPPGKMKKDHYVASTESKLASNYQFFPEGVRKMLPPLYSQEEVKDPTVHVKFFCPWSDWKWYATEFDGEDTFFGWVVGFEKELGYFSLSEMQSVSGPGGLKLERDIHFRPQPLSQVFRTHGEEYYLEMTIPKSTDHRVFRAADGKLLFAGNKKDALREFKRLGGTKAGYRLFLTSSDTLPRSELLPGQYSTTEHPQTKKKLFVRINERNASSFAAGSVISWEDFKEDDKKVRERGERPASVEIVKESAPGNGNGQKSLPATIQGEPIPDKYRELMPFIDEPLPPGTDLLVPAVVAEEGERKIDAVLRQLKEGVEGIQDSTQFRLFLTTMSKFHNYSIGNLFLIAWQKPEATHVAGFQTWKNLGRWVKKGSVGIAILAPVLPPKPKEEREEGEEEEPLTPVYFKVVHVFDISQTEGEPLAEFDVPTLTGEANEELFAQALALAKDQGIEVSFELRPHQDPGKKGSFSGKDIWVKSDEPRAQQLKSLLHELAHYYSEGVFRIPRKDAETIAESAAFVVGAHFGFDSGTRSFPYVALWAEDKKVLQANLAAIRKVATAMLDGLEKPKLQEGKLIPALKPFEPYHFAEYVLRYNRFEDAEIPIYSGLTKRSPLRIPDHIWREVIKETEGTFIKQGDLNVFHIDEKERPSYMRAAPTWRDIASTLPIGTKGSIPNPREEKEFIYDSPELIPFTIEDIGYREKLDDAFEAAIARAKGG